MLFLRNLTEPSANKKLAPPGWRLTNAFDAAEKRQPVGASRPCQFPLQSGSEAGKVFEFQPSGTVVPAVPPLLCQKLLSATRDGITSPTISVLLVPSVTLARVTVWSVR